MSLILTPRLVLRRWREADVAPHDRDQLRPGGDALDRRRLRPGRGGADPGHHGGVGARLGDRGFGLFAVEVRATGELAGFTGLSVPRYLPEALPAVEIGWRLGRSFWGQGLATEAARAALDFGVADRGLERTSASPRWATTRRNGS